MTVDESRAVRTLLVRLGAGADVTSAIEDLVHDEDIDEAWVRGIGELAKVALDDGRRFARCRVVGLEGTLRRHGEKVDVRLHVTLSRPSKDGVVGGRIEAAEALDLDLRVECFERVARAAASNSWTVAGEEAEGEPSEAATVSWADVVAASAEPEPVFRRDGATKQRVFDPPPGEEGGVAALVPQKGDFIRHLQFGLCRVDRPHEGGGVVVKLPSGIRKTLRLDYLDVGAPRMEGNRRVFPVRPRRR